MSLSLPHEAGRPSLILHERARVHHHREPSGTGRLSVKCIVAGEARYAVGSARYALRPGALLVLNAGSPYEVDICSRGERVESLCVFFGDALAADVLGTLAVGDDRSLDRPERDASAGPPVRFVERLHGHVAGLTPALLALRDPARAGDRAALGERLALLLERLAALHRLTVREAARLPAARRATRLELYRRAHLARDYLDASLGGVVSLAELARVTAMSPYHLLRTFRDAFGETPHRYLTRRRLERAAELLSRPDASVSRVCLDVGFESLGSFSSLFRRRFGVSPSRYARLAPSVGRRW